MRPTLVAVAALLAACGGAGGGSARPEGSSSQAATAFMRAAADSNLSRMAELWGTSKGPVSRTHPDNYEKRLVVMQAYLRGDSARVVSDVSVSGDDQRRSLSIALYRGTCVKQIPAVMVRAREGWIVYSIDISAAGNPALPCGPGGAPPATRRGVTR